MIFFLKSGGIFPLRTGYMGYVEEFMQHNIYFFIFAPYNCITDK